MNSAKILRFSGDTSGAPANQLVLPSNPFAKLGLSLIPFTPVPLSGPEALYGWGRLALYSSLAYMSFSKSKKLAYAFGAAAGISLITSMAGKAWNDAKEKTQSVASGGSAALPS